MTRSQMIETVARKTGFTEAQVETTMDAMFDQIADCLRADEKVTIAGFGRFEMRPRKPKAYTNPKTKVSSRLESTSIPGFTGPVPSPASRPAAASSRSWKQARLPRLRKLSDPQIKCKELCPPLGAQLFLFRTPSVSHLLNSSLGEGASPCGKVSLWKEGGIALAMTEGVR